MSKPESDRQMAERLRAILLLMGAKMKDFADLYDVFVGLSALISTQEAAIIHLFGELVETMPEGVRQELRNMTLNATKGHHAPHVGVKSLETLLREILRDNRRGEEKK